MGHWIAPFLAVTHDRQVSCHPTCSIVLAFSVTLWPVMHCLRSVWDPQPIRQLSRFCNAKSIWIWRENSNGIVFEFTFMMERPNTGRHSVVVYQIRHELNVTWNSGSDFVGTRFPFFKLLERQFIKRNAN